MTDTALNIVFGVVAACVGFFLYCLWNIAVSLDALLELAKKPI